tara:strand:- start:373 stop:630 length:258 start_codon:yes stop_codon:yes gene_type:complete
MSVKGPKKFTTEELQSLQNLQNKINQVQMQFGQLQMAKIRLQDQEDILKGKLKTLNEEETNTAKNLTDKYGKGSLDIETGEFIPA